MEDLQGTIDTLRNELFDDELEKFERIVDRLEGYELAYSVILDSNRQLEDKFRKIKELVDYMEYGEGEIIEMIQRIVL